MTEPKKPTRDEVRAIIKDILDQVIQGRDNQKKKLAKSEETIKLLKSLL